MEIKVPIEELRSKKLFVAAPMYGGQCSGMFARSISDLSALCTHYGIQVRFYFLFNESLITRARNYCADEFMRSGDTHLMFIDSDIGFNAQDVIAMLALQSDESPYDILAGPYPKKCLNSKTLVVTPEGKVTIAKLVNDGYSGDVLSYSNEGKYEWKKVTNRWVEPNLGKVWVNIITSNKMKSRSDVVLTSDHEVAVIDNPLDPKINYLPASSVVGKYLVKTPKLSDVSNRNDRSPLLNSEQVSVLIGAILGDGNIDKNGHYICNYGDSQLEYNKFKHSIIGGRFNVSTNRHVFKNGQTQYLRDIVYTPEGKKTPNNVINLVDEKALAIIYMDNGNRYCYPDPITEEVNDYTWWYSEDGSTKSSVESPGEGWTRGRKSDAWQVSSSIATVAFGEEFVNLFIKHLNDRFGLTAYSYNQNGQFGIKFNQENTKKLYEIISPYVPESMEYKLSPEYRGGFKHEFNVQPLNISAAKIFDVVEYEDKNNSQLYDIEVEDNHNLFVNDGVLVHNCISWEKIKAAVDKGVADEDPNVLERFVGDYVFNPVGEGVIPLGEPAQVSEAGTGFMMIRRKTFERFQEAYPQQLYKPDHVRTEHFDGSREIMAFFDTPIDPETKRYLSEDYMFCTTANSRIITKDGIKTISEIHKTGYRGEVLSVNPETLRNEWKPILNSFRRKNLDKKWVKLIPENKNSTKPILKVTSDHQVAYIEDLSNPVIQYTSADNMTNKWMIRYYDENGFHKDSNGFDFAVEKVKEVVEFKTHSALYDIEVEDNHNFYANGTLIHNCQWSRKIGMQVWLCPWINLSHVGSFVFGGSLADLASIGQSATADINQLKKKK